MDDCAEELTGTDYVRRPLLELTSHPDFNLDVYKGIADILGMTTAQLESVIKGVSNG